MPVPLLIDRVPAQVPASTGRDPRPGDAVYWDATNNGAAVATTDAQSENVIGIVTYFPSILGDILSSIPSGANSATYVQYTDGEIMPIVVMGTVWLLAGAALEYHQIVRQDTTDFDYESQAKPAAHGDLISQPIVCVDVAVADTGIFKGRIGYGRAI